MTGKLRGTVLFAALLMGVLPCALAVADEREEFFETWVRPVLIEHCYECHSAEFDDIQGGLRLDHREGLIEGGDSGPAVVPGKPDESLLLEAIGYDNLDLQMPPDGPLSTETVDKLTEWIAGGAFDPRDPIDTGRQEDAFDLQQRKDDHWAWQPVRTEFADDVSVDWFVNRKLGEHGLRPAPPAEARVLVRRLYLDLVGLPPTPDEVDEFLTAWESDRDDAWESAVEKLLSEPRFGEHWASGWLDVVRFSETKGHVTDQERPYAWKYRDYVIDAFHDDLPYDRFVIEHLAGDLLPASLARRGRDGSTNVAPTATGALFMHEMHFMAVDPVKQRWDEINSQVEMLGKAFLGLTLDCARCHDHKFDAISQADYYALAGFFYSTELGRVRTGPRDEVPDSMQPELAELETQYESYLNGKREQRRKAQTPKVGEADYFPISEELGIQAPGDTAKLFGMMRKLESIDPTWSLWVRSAQDVSGQDVPLLIRGNHRNPGETTSRRFLAAISSEEPVPQSELGGGSGRRWLAAQVASPDNPLTSRVWVNRIWHHLFGTGIVDTPNNFGQLGGRPSHPELLDYLASRLMHSGWSTKSVIREIVHSQTYQRSSSEAAYRNANTMRASEIDPSNRLLGKQNARRMTAEQIRDTLLSITGRLDATSYGPGVDCFVPSYATANKPSNVPKSGPLDGDGRRSIYIKVRRNFCDPFLQTFDFPDRGRSIGRRNITRVPGQALAMMNSPLVHDLSKSWGSRLAADHDSETVGFREMWRAALARDPTRDELSQMQELASRLRPLVDSESQVWKELAHFVLNHPELLVIR